MPECPGGSGTLGRNSAAVPHSPWGHSEHKKSNQFGVDFNEHLVKSPIPARHGASQNHLSQCGHEEEEPEQTENVVNLQI